MFGRSTVRASAVVCVLLLSCLQAFGANAIGVLHPMCGIPYGYLLYITSFQGHRLEKAIRFKVFGDYGLKLYANQWVDSPRDDDAKSSRIRVVHVSRHWWQPMEMSGDFEIVFADGRKLEGSFKAKYVKPPGLFICE